METKENQIDNNGRSSDEHTLVNESVGNDTPKKKPKISPAKVVTISLIVSFGFLTVPLHPNRRKCNSYQHHETL